MNISSDEVVLWSWGFLNLRATILYTWLVMALLVGFSWWITRSVSSDSRPGRGQNLLEILVGGMEEQIREVSQQDPARYLPFIGTLFLFIAVSNVLAVVPGFEPPTGALSTTAALALCVFVAVPVFGIARRGVGPYLRAYLQPTVIMLPFNIIGELSRTLALAVRLFGNIMSGVKIGAVLIAVTPFLPCAAALQVPMTALSLLTGLIQAYIFAVLAMVYIASATRAHEDLENASEPQGEPNHG